MDRTRIVEEVLRVILSDESVRGCLLKGRKKSK